MKWPWSKREKEEKEKKIVNGNTIQDRKHHKIRIDNLYNEYEILNEKLFNLQNNIDMLRSIRDKEIDKIILRMSIVKYEIGIREEILGWL